MSVKVRVFVLPFILGAILVGTLANLGLTTYETQIIKQHLQNQQEGP